MQTIHDGDLAQDHEDLLQSYLRFGLHDVEEWRSNRKGKSVSKTDEEIAFDLFAEDATTMLSVLSDVALVRRLGEADEEELDESTSERGIPEEESSLQRTEQFSPFCHWRSLNTWCARLFSSTQNAEGSSSSSLVGSSTRKEKVDCIVCMDHINGVATKVPCGHFYGSDCLLDLFRSAMTDESLFPPRCCKQEIPLALIRTHMKTMDLTHYEEKAHEFSTPVRLYCSDKACSRFLGPRSDTVSSVFCPSCDKSTCARCTNAAHSLLIPCSDDAAAQELLALGREHGWQRCPGCRTLVELNLGCYHMTCRCRAQFCYLCAATWKTCQCPQWDEARLLVAAEERVVRMRVPQPIPGPGELARRDAVQNPVADPPLDFAAHVRRMADELRVNHDCEHRRFSRRSGGGNCENCHDYLPLFLFGCTGCQMLLCRRCWLNRV